MRVQEIQLVVEEDGDVEIPPVPVKMGDTVKVILLMPNESPTREAFYPLRGVGPYRFDNPTEPVAPEDWEL
jgi:hypothetical protein